MVGLLFTNVLTEFAKTIIIIIEIITAITIMVNAPYIPLVIPTAVRIESKEKTISIKIICMMMLVKVLFFFGFLALSLIEVCSIL